MNSSGSEYEIYSSWQWVKFLIPLSTWQILLLYQLKKTPGDIQASKKQMETEGRLRERECDWEGEGIAPSAILYDLSASSSHQWDRQLDISQRAPSWGIGLSGLQAAFPQSARAVTPVNLSLELSKLTASEQYSVHTAPRATFETCCCCCCCFCSLCVCVAEVNKSLGLRASLVSLVCAATTVLRIGLTKGCLVHPQHLEPLVSHPL